MKAIDRPCRPTNEALAQKATAWIRNNLLPARRKCDLSSYGLKHEFAVSPGGGYFTNGEWKYLMVETGREPVDESAQNTRYHVQMREQK